jgi:LPXTG-site transpeptidase (sortase) family protein
MSKTTLVLSLLVIGLLSVVINLIPVQSSLPAPYTPTAFSAPTTASITLAPPTASSQPVEASATPAPLETAAARPTRYLEPTEPALPPTAETTPLPQLIIPDLDIEQPIVPIPITNGNWDLTNLGEQVGWLTTTGERPEDDLAMALVGHINLARGHSGPFVDLGQLEHLDAVIYRAGGLDYVYAVQGSKKVKPEDVEALYVEDGKQLLLVTCTDWSYFWRAYARRLIVTTKLLRVEASPSP